ncbi:MAG: mycothiol synthase [Acidimicrobiaceae bacterium]|nr:mycothiol synthase [Acidimicrobiaceae bacterium]|tara:strand:- start:358 stop:1056 length:699 start_codon:yes stop_codon:yes gene_type:complete
MDILISDEAPSGFDLSLTVPEGFRRDLLPAALAAALSRASMPTDSLIQIWIEDAQMDDDDLLNRIGFSSYRDLWQMRCKFPPNGEGISTRPFICGVDDEAFLEVNSRAFSWHPEQGSLDTQKLNDTLKEEWFDNEGFLLLEIENRLAGFCWTKLHHEDDLVLGEIYAIAVDPYFHGRGFGKPLTIAGLNHLLSVGAELGMLYVESDNKPAIRIYEDIGFTHFSTNRAFRNSA